METEKNDLKLGLRLHAILKMKTTLNGKMKRIRIVDFWVMRNSRQISAQSEL